MTNQGDFMAGVTPPPTNILPEDLAQRYRDMDRKVLADMMIQLGLFGKLGTPEDVARHNVAVEILRDCGVLRPNVGGKLEISGVERVINAVLSTT